MPSNYKLLPTKPTSKPSLMMLNLKLPVPPMLWLTSTTPLTQTTPSLPTDNNNWKSWPTNNKT
jgi:hypothetical protein